MHVLIHLLVDFIEWLLMVNVLDNNYHLETSHFIGFI